jgi:hypothetical protein
VKSQVQHAAQEAMKAFEVRFFWVERAVERGDFSYHWAADCPWLAVAHWYGGPIVTSKAPPREAVDAGWVRRTLERRLQGSAWEPGVGGLPIDEPHQERALCAACTANFPEPTSFPLSVDEEPCLKCKCARDSHINGRGPLDTGCSEAWDDLVWDAREHVLENGLIHCPCDGYVPPEGGGRCTGRSSR